MAVHRMFYTGSKILRTHVRENSQATTVQRWELDSQSGEIFFRENVAEILDPSFLVKHPSREIYYGVAEQEPGFTRESLLLTWRKEMDGSWTEVGRQEVGGRCACHLSVHPNERFLMIACYVSGQFCLFPLDEEGVPGAERTVFTLEGEGANPLRQTSPHAHFIATHPGGKWTYGTDLGTDRIYLLGLDEKNRWFFHPKQPFATSCSGAGPRHIAFDPAGHYLYVVNELSCTLDVFQCDPETGILACAQSLSLLPERFYGQASGGAVTLHPSGRFLYVSLRGWNHVVVLRLNPPPISWRNREAITVAEKIQHVPSGGEEPRFIGLDPTGNFLLSCNQGSHRIVVYRVDLATGELCETGYEGESPWCSCVVF
ncbi:MAG: lactonase family protein [Planctomycetia bacterium]|nr:lactonase family protein [Planctomycetia bacterium]